MLEIFNLIYMEGGNINTFINDCVYKQNICKNMRRVTLFQIPNDSLIFLFLILSTSDAGVSTSDSNRVPVPCPGLTCPGCGTGLTCPGPVPGPVPAPASDSSRGSFSSLKIIIWNGDGQSWKEIIESFNPF